MATRTFAPPGDKHELEAGTNLSPRFDARGLVTAVVTDEADGTLLMVAHMSAEALVKTVESGYAHFYSRSRERLWMKGGSSGNVLAVKEIRVDCDQDALWLKVAVGGDGVTCHTGSRGCFYRKVDRRPDGSIKLSVDG